MSLARSGIAVLVLSGCNAIFGLDDNSRFEAPPGDTPVDVPLGTCVTDHFDVLATEVWDRLPATPFPVQVIDGGLRFEVSGSEVDVDAGLISRQRFDFTGGSVDLTVADPAGDLVEVGVFATLDDTHRVGLVSRANTVSPYFITPDASSFAPTTVTDSRLRIRHEPGDGTIHWETAPAGSDVFVELEAPREVPAVTSVAISLIGRTRAAGQIDTAIVDDLVLTAHCP